MHNIWEGHFCNRVVTVEMVPIWKNGEPKTLTLRRPIYQKIIRDHESANCSTSFMPFPGMYNYTDRYILNCFEADGTPEYDVERSLKEILEALKWNDQQVFIMVAHIGDVVIAGFFSNVIKGVEQLAFMWAMHSVAQVF